MKQILVGVDRSAGAANAVRWACALASRCGAAVVVMTGFEPTDSEMPPGRLETLVAREQQELAAWLETLQPGGVPMRTVVELGDPRTGILTVADREGADMIVVGRVGRSAGPGLLHIGSLAEWLAHHVDRPVAVIGDGASTAIHDVLVGVDGSDGARAAVAWVRQLGGDSGTRVAAASVDEAADEWTPDDRRDTSRRDLERRIHDDYAAGLVGTDVDVDAVALDGPDVADVLLQAAQERQSDLVVVGARGLGGLTGLRIGGVALRTLHRADRPIVLVPPG